MKKIFIAIAIATTLFACQSKPEGTTAEVTDQQTAGEQTGTSYTVDAVNSSLTFIGTKPVGTHTGKMQVSSGTVSILENNISGGNFVIDMSKMEILDKDTNYSYKLVNHLLSAEFFDAAKYPQAKFEITACTPIPNDSTATHKISGNLTLKDSTKNISFPARISVSETEVHATADFVIDRTQWGVHYGNDKSLKDKFIYPEVKIIFDIYAKH
ncbi:MAG: YceI family protein [Bacteroidetes bacterium]|nr:YceI family protein [Bacteroidota bacterium]